MISDFLSTVSACRWECERINSVSIVNKIYLKQMNSWEKRWKILKWSGRKANRRRNWPQLVTEQVQTLTRKNDSDLGFFAGLGLGLYPSLATTLIGKKRCQIKIMPKTPNFGNYTNNVEFKFGNNEPHNTI